MGYVFKNIDWKAVLFPARGDLPRAVTSFDVLKSFAVVLMVVDHVGWLLFPQFEILRVVGRFCVPIWFFLIGYADTRSVPVRWYVAGGILALSSALVGLDPLPLCVLFTFVLVRYGIDPVWQFMVSKPHYFWWIVLLLAFFGYVTDLLFEYGTMGLLLALIGYLVRRRTEIEESFGAGFVQLFGAIVLAAYAAMEFVKFGFSLPSIMVLAAGLIGVFFVLDGFKAETKTMHAPLVQFMGRYSLEIYVIHLLILKAVFGLQKLASSLVV